MRSKQTLFAVLCCSLLFPVSLLYGQANGSFSGTIADKTGGVITGATVKVSSQGTGVERETKTDDSGHYLVPLLPVAFYTVHVEASGFQASEQKDLRLQIGEHREVDFTLNPASVSSTVEVTATDVAVQTANPTLGQVITSEQVATLPLNGRDFVQLATLTPGTTQETNPNSFFNGGASSEVSARGTFSLSVGGSRVQSTDWLLDNNDNNELTAGGISILPSIDAIQEFKVLTYNYSAEYGTRAGPTVLVTTKSGSNAFHGSLFEYFRNTALDARSYFAAFREKFNLNQYGGSIGGPIQKDKTFFFADYQGKHQRHGIPFIGLIPTQAMMGGDFTMDPLGGVRGSKTSTFPNLVNPYGVNYDILNSPPNQPPLTLVPTSFQCDPSGNPLPAITTGLMAGTQAVGATCNKIPSNLFDSVGKQMLALYPATTGVNPVTQTNYANVPVRKLDENSFDVRLDHNFSSKDSVFARFSYDQATSFVPGGSPGFAEASPFASTQNITNHGRNAALSETHLFSDRTINQVNAGFNRIFNHIKSFGDSTCYAATIGILGADLDSRCPNAPPGISQSTKDCMSCGLSSTQLAQYWSLGDRGFAPFQGGTNVYSFSDTLDMIRGKHDVRVGFGFRANQMNVETNGFQDGYFIINPPGANTTAFNQGFTASITNDNAADLLLGQVNGAIHDQTFLGATTGRRWKMFRPFVQDDWRLTPDITVNLGFAWALVTPISESEGRQSNFDFATGQYLVAGNLPISNCSNCVRSSNVGLQFDKRAVEPRIGFAWRPMGSQTTAIRGGYAVYHDSAWSQGAQGLWQNPPYYAEVDQFNYGAGFPCPASNTSQNCGLRLGFLQPNLQPITSPPNPAAFTGTILSQNLNFKQGTVQQFNLNVERQIPGDVVLTAGYAGSRSHHILVDGLNMNVGSPGACDGGKNGYFLGCGPGGAAFAAPYSTGAFSAFTNINNVTDTGSANYDSLQLKAETKSAKHGLYALVGYTWARTFDSGFPDGAGTFPGAQYWPLPGAKGLDWGLSQINLNDSFTASILYDLPFGRGKAFGANWGGVSNAVLGNWQVTLIEKITSGFPLFTVASANNSGVNFQWNGSSLNRPNEVGDPNKPGPVAANPGCQAPSKVHTLSHWFNPCAFMDAPAGELGDATRTPVYGPRFVNTDFSAIKNFPIHEAISMQFRAEFFNLFNHAQYYLQGGPSGMQDVDSQSSFGVVNGTVNNPRVVQFALRLSF
jgi:Carboxypeptidase regulatory-like domain